MLFLLKYSKLVLGAFLTTVADWIRDSLCSEVLKFSE